MKKKLLSYIVPVYNTAPVLLRCLDSIYQQDFTNDEFEVIIVNDGSTDNSDTLCQDFKSTHDNVKYIKQQNMGLSDARNNGFDISQGKYIMFVDSDDFMEPHSLKKVVGEAEHFDCDFINFHCKYYPGGSLCYNQPFSLHKIFTGEHVILNGMGPGSVWGNLYKSDFIRKSGIKFKPKIYHQDFVFNICLDHQAERVVFTDTICYNYVTNLESTLRTKNIQKKQKSIIDTIKGCGYIRDYAESKKKELSKDMYSYLMKTVNSSMVGTLLTVMQHQDNYGFDFINTCISLGRNIGLYPIPKPTRSFKTTFLLHIINKDWLLKTITKFLRVL